MTKELKFIHITKTAGTSIEKLGIKFGYRWGKFHKEYGRWHDFFPKKDEELKNQYDWFTVVRNPYSRLISEFYCLNGGVNPAYKNHDKNLFNSILCRKILSRPTLIGNHWSEQYKYIDSNYYINILKYEELPVCFNKLMREYNIHRPNSKFTLKLRIQANKTNKIFNISDLSVESIQLINEIYHLDFEYFGYEKING